MREQGPTFILNLPANSWISIDYTGIPQLDSGTKVTVRAESSTPTDHIDTQWVKRRRSLIPGGFCSSKQSGAET